MYPLKNVALHLNVVECGGAPLSLHHTWAHSLPPPPPSYSILVSSRAAPEVTRPPSMCSPMLLAWEDAQLLCECSVSMTSGRRLLGLRQDRLPVLSLRWCLKLDGKEAGGGGGVEGNMGGRSGGWEAVGVGHMGGWRLGARMRLAGGAHGWIKVVRPHEETGSSGSSG